MAKQSGVGVNRLFVGGYDLSGDVGAVDTCKGGHALFDVTGMDKFGIERIAGLADGELSFTAWWNKATGQAHEALSSLPATARTALFFMDVVAGAPAACLTGRQVGYDPARATGSALAAKVQVQADGAGLEWGDALTTGKQTIASAAAGTSVDGGNSWAASVAIASSSVANPTVITTSTAHGLVTGDTVFIAGHSGSTPSINGDRQVTVTSTTQFTIPVNVTVGGTGGTMVRTSAHDGAAAYLQVFSVGSGTATVVVQDSSDNSAWADVSGLSFTGATGRTEQRLVLASTAVVRRYRRINVTGTFTNAVIACVLVPYFAPAT